MTTKLPVGVYPTPSGTFKAHVRLPDGRTRTPTFPTASEAERWRAAALEAIALGNPIPSKDVGRPKADGPYRRFVDVANEFLDHHYGAGTASAKTEARSRRLMELWVLPRFGSRCVGEILPIEVSDFRRAVMRERSHAYAKGICWLLEATLRYAFHIGAIRTNPADLSRVSRGVGKPPRRMHYFSIREVLAVATEMPPEHTAALWIQRMCGLRSGEVYELRIADVDHQERILYVPGTKTPSAARWVGIPDQVYRLIIEHIGRFRANAAPDDSLMVTGGENGAAAYRTAFSDAKEWVDLQVRDDERASPHALRASMITDLVEVCENPRTVSRIAGHSMRGTDGGSPVTYGIYVLPGRDRATLVELARQLNERLTAIDLQISDPLKVWMTAEEAAAVLGVSHTTVRERIRMGILHAATLRPPGTRKQRKYVLRSSVESALRKSEIRVGVTSASAELGISAYLVQKYAQALGLDLLDDLPGYDRLSMTPAHFRQLSLEVEAERRFREDHLTYAQAASRLGVAVGTIRSWVVAGHLSANSDDTKPWWESAAQTERWVTRSSVDRAVKNPPASLATWRKTHRHGRPAGHLSVAEAAAEVGVCIQTIHNWMKSGALAYMRVPRGPQWTYWVPAEAVSVKRGSA